MTRDPDRTHTLVPIPTDDPAFDAGLAVAFGAESTPGGWSQPPLLRDDPSDNAPLVQPSSAEALRAAADRYHFFGEIARGGMGVILKGRDPDLGRDVAVKVLKAELADKVSAAQRFVEEAQVCGQLQHPGVVPVYDLARFADGRPYFAMKLVKGQTLAEMLTDRADPAAERGKFLHTYLQVCHTIAYAHSRGVIHRDLKPANVMVGSFGEVLVMDWGLAKVLPRGGVADEERATQASRGRERPEPTIIHTARSGTGTGSETLAGSVMGTPAFMPPEQAGGEVDKLDERTDVFGLGAILCVILTGKPPYVGSDSDAVRLMAIRGRLDDALARLDTCGADAELIALCKRSLAADRGARLRHAGVLRDALAAHLVDVESRAQRAEVARAAAEAKAVEEANTRRVAEQKVAEEHKRRRVQLALAASVALLVLGGGAFGWYADRQATGQRLKAEAAREQVTRLLALATELRKEYRFKQAAAALDEARDAAAAAPDLLPAVDRDRADLEIVVDLDAIHAMRSTWIAEAGGKGRFDEEAAPSAYRRAFAARGLDVAADPDAGGAGVTGSAVRAELVAALDDWLVLEPDAAVRDRVLAFLRRADPGSPAAPFRDPAVWANKFRLAELAAEAEREDLPPGAAVAIAQLLWQQGLDPAPPLRRAVAVHPRDFEVAFLLGRILMNRPADVDECVGVYRAARALRPDNQATLINLGVALANKGDVDGAVAACREAIRLDPKFAQAHFNLGHLLSRKADWDGAVAACREAIRLDPKFVLAHYDLGNLLRQKGDWDGAITEIREAIRLDPKYAPAHYSLGLPLYKKGDLDGAVAAYREAIRLDPTHAPVHSRLGAALMDKEDVEGAIACYREA
ncbi:MAG TPA: serine/threonine-protein kinase, partial [Gemmataceae bacterium]|nr:serine/threonine-protein kinase [Gemmataceae bacterium]